MFWIFDPSCASEHQLALRLTPVCIWSVGKNDMTLADQRETLLGREHVLFGTIKTREKVCVCVYVNNNVTFEDIWLEPFHRDTDSAV